MVRRRFDIMKTLLLRPVSAGIMLQVIAFFHIIYNWPKLLNKLYRSNRYYVNRQ